MVRLETGCQSFDDGGGRAARELEEEEEGIKVEWEMELLLFCSGT